MTPEVRAPGAVVLLSGGLDSATALAIAREEAAWVDAVTFDYGQRHRHELDAARRVAAHLGVRRHVVIAIDLRAVGGSALTGDLAVPKGRDEAAMARGGIPVTYVPARNTVFLAFALGCAEVAGATDLYLGVNAVDYSGYPDCRPAFVEAFERLANVATRAGVEGHVRFRVRAPLVAMSKAEIIRQGLTRGVDYALTHSCYDPDAGGRPCGACDSCVLRARGFAEVGVPDPLYAAVIAS